MIPFETGLCTIRKQYFSLYPPHLIDLDLEPRLSLARHQPWIVHHLVSSSSSSTSSSSYAASMLATKYPPADDYQRKFWKLLISALEAELCDDEAVADELELDDRIAEHYSQLVMKSTCPTNVPGPSYKTYIYDSPPSTRTRPPAINDPSRSSTLINSKAHEIPHEQGHEEEQKVDWMDLSTEKRITLLEAQTTIEAGSTGLRTWTASLYLATKFLQIPSSTLLTHPNRTPPSFPPPSSTPHPPPSLPDTDQTSTPSHFLELGSGTGFLACFLAQTGEDRTIWATDVGEPDEVDKAEGEDEDNESVQRGRSTDEEEGDVDPVMTAHEVLRKGPLWGLRGNIELNRPQFQPKSRVIPLSLDWYDAIPGNSMDDPTQREAYEKMVAFSRGLPDDLVILATDVIYDPDLVLPLCATLRLFLTQTSNCLATSRITQSNGRFVLLAATIRNRETMDRFYVECARIGLKIDHLPSSSSSELASSSSSDVETKDVDPIFWNANVWEGGDVRMIKVWV